MKINRVQIKICGITKVEDAKACTELGADMIGLNFYPQSSRYLEPQRAREIVEVLAGSLRAVGVFVDAPASEIRNIANAGGIECVQVHGDLSAKTCRELAREFRVIRAFSTDEQFQPEDAGSFPDCDVLLDAHHAELRGGTGVTCDWSAARATLPFARFLILSGGLNAQNVACAIAAVAPHAVDVCSGVERAPGVKDYGAIRNFIAAVRRAERSVSAPSP